MNEVKIFNSEEFGDIRTVQLNNETYFVGKDVATALGYADTFGALKKHIMDEDKLVCQIDSAGQKRDVTVSGHANYAVSGSDIVCAGVTALAQTLIKSIKDLTDDKIEYEISPGRVDIKYGNLSEKSKTLVDSFFIGICMIAEDFPEYVRIM